MPEDANDEESLDGLSFEQQREGSSVEEVVPESSCIGAENSLVWSTDGHQPPNRRLFARPSSPIHGRNLASSLHKEKDPNTPDFRFTRTRKSVEARVEVLGTQASQPLPFQEKGTPHPRRFLTNDAPAILSPGSSVSAKEEQLTSPASTRSPHSSLLAREAPYSASTLDDVQSTNSTQDTPKQSVLTQALPPKAHAQPPQQALRHRSSQPQGASQGLSDIGASGGYNLPPLDTPSTQLLIGLASQESAIKSPLSEKTTAQSKLAMERDARAAAAEARRQKQLEESTTDEDMDDEEGEATDSETEQQMEEELKKAEEKARKVKEEEARKAKEEEARREEEEKAQEEARKAKEEETRKKKEELAWKVQEEERKAKEKKARMDKEEGETRMKEQQEAEKGKAEEASQKAEEAKAAVEAENKKAAKAAEKEATEKKKAEAIAEKLRKKQEQEELKRIEKERRAKGKAEESERKKQEKADKGKVKRNAKKAPEDAEEKSAANEDPKAPEPPASQAGKRQRPTPNERPSAAEDVPQGKKQKTTTAKQANNPKVDDAPRNPDLHPPATPKVSALRKTSPNGTPAAKARRSVSFMDMTASVLTPQTSSASEAPANVYPKTPVPPPVFIPGTVPTLVPTTKPAAKSKTPIPLPDLRATMKVTTKKAAPTKTKAVETKPVTAKGNKSKLSQEVVEESEPESDNTQKPNKPAQKAAPPTQDQAEAGTQKQAAGAKVTVSQAQGDSDIDMDYVPANEVAPKRVTRAVAGAVLHDPLPKPTRGKKVAEVATPPPAFTNKPVHDPWGLSSTSEDDEEGEKEAGQGRARIMVSEIRERAVVVPEANPITKPNTKSSASSETGSETDTTSPDDSESGSDDASPPPKSTPRAPSPKAQQIANSITKALSKTIASNTTIPTASRQIPPSSQPVTPFLPPSTQKYKSLSQLAGEEDYPEVSEGLSSQAPKKREAESDSDDEDEEESSSESGSGSDSDSSSGVDFIPNTMRASRAKSADKKKSSGRNSLGGFLNRSKLAVFSKVLSWVS